MVLVLLIFFLLYLLIMFFMSLGLHLTYYPLFISLIPWLCYFFYQRFCFFTRPKFRTDDWHRMWVSWTLSTVDLCTCWRNYGLSISHHARLGHPSLAKMQQLVPSLSNVSSLLCDPCQLGKHIRSSFPNSVSQRAPSPLS